MIISSESASRTLSCQLLAPGLALPIVLSAMLGDAHTGLEFTGIPLQVFHTRNRTLKLQKAPGAHPASGQRYIRDGGHVSVLRAPFKGLKVLFSRKKEKPV